MKCFSDLEIGNVLEYEGIVDGDLSADLVVHRVDVGLVHGHAFLGQGGGVVDRDVVELGMLAPVFILNKQVQNIRNRRSFRLQLGTYRE